MLNSNQLEKLTELCVNWIDQLLVDTDDLQLGETDFTGTILLPQLRDFVSTLKKPELYVRGDKGPAVQPVVWREMTFFPDLAIVSNYQKYIAFEVKVLRESDPSGSLAKAIGQTSIYSSLGYKYSFGLIFDLRTPRSSGTYLGSPIRLMQSSSMQISVFADEVLRRPSSYMAEIQGRERSP